MRSVKTSQGPLPQHHLRCRRRTRRRWLALATIFAPLLGLLAAVSLILPSCSSWEKPLFDMAPQTPPQLAVPADLADSTSGGAGRGSEEGVMTVRFLGAATVLFEESGTRMVTDPVLTPTMGGVFGRGYRAPRLDALPKVDAVLITHFHYDHFSSATLARLDRQAVLIGPKGLAGRTASLKFRRTIELAPWQSTTVGPWTVTAVPAWHPTGRNPITPYDPATTVGYVLESAGPTTYVSGDTEYRGHFVEIAGRFRIDLALLDVNLHLPGPDAERALKDLGNPAWMPLHWGGYPAFDSLIQQRQIAALRDRDVPQGRMLWLRPGDTARLVAPTANHPAGGG